MEDALKIALAAVREASAACRGIQTKIGPDVLEKRDRSPVTVADFTSQALICRALGDAFPADPVVAEESSAELRKEENSSLLDRVLAEAAGVGRRGSPGEICDWIDHGAAGDPCRRFWTLDPIDGTKGFLRGEQYAIALALVEDGRVTLAAMACPNLPGEPGTWDRPGVVYTAMVGRGTQAWPPEDGDAGPAVHCSCASDPAAARFCESVEAGHSSHGDSARVAGLLGITRPPVRLDSQAKYAVVARGEAEIYMRLPTRPGYVERIWDHAAGYLVITEAGGKVSDIHGKPLDFSRGAGLEANRGIIATNGRLHEEVLAALRDAGVSDGA